MANKVVNVSIIWVNKEPPKLAFGEFYAPVVRVIDNLTEMYWSVASWSVAIANFSKDGKHADMWFLLDNAPKEMLVSGGIFDLYEGNTRVAHIEII